ncbi:MAG: BatA domain-containing protein [Bacteroidota bacterium]
MLQLLQPIWLFAASGIIIPIAIHLWNIKPGKTLKVGSIALLTHTSQEHARSLRFTELFLLLLRCLLIILLALLLAQPYWVNAGSGKGWILMEKKDVQQAYNHFKPITDSLLKSGYEFHLFEERFEKKDFQSFLKEESDTAQVNPVSYWSLVKQLDKKLPQGFPVCLFTGNRLNRFAGSRPEVSIAVKWKTFTDKDSIHTFISKAYSTSADSVNVIIGETSPSTTVYTHESIAINKPRQKGIALQVINGNLAVQYKNNTPVLVDTATLNITIFSDNYLNDARYVQSALQSIQQVSKRKIKLSVINKSAAIAKNQDWLFWLSDQPIPRNIKTAAVLAYEKGDAIPVYSWLQVDNSASARVLLYKRIPYQQDDAANIWQDGFGKPVLTKETNDDQQLYRFYSHFDPSWNELAWDASFPQLIYALIDPVVLNETINSSDRRIIGETQIQLNSKAVKKYIDTPDSDTENATHVLWMIILVLFFVERFFSFKPKKERAYA